ncbi:uncharacterized protein RJT21DRAFT_112011 [Scheffersomyces amazonensis]|uniref:uncharacterized protein n=1 Tax=Scheffersomyces amazonensis TaxID=1078765 RepID=UPI00315D9A31
MFGIVTRRRFSSSIALLGKSYGRTVINPSSGFELTKPSFIPKSCIILSTPSNIPRVIEQVIQKSEDGIQFVVAGTDSVVPNSNRNGISSLWFDQPLNIVNSVEIDDISNDNSTQNKNWSKVESNFRLKVSDTNTFDISLANTSFVSDFGTTLFYLDSKLDHSGKALKELTVELPKGIVTESSKIHEFDQWTPLYDHESEEPFLVTDFKGNLLKTINNKSASGYLENNSKLMGLGSKDTEVYVKIFKGNNSLPFKYKVVAGGGGWGAKANIIALSPEAKITKGDRIEFYMLTPNDRFSDETIPIQEYIDKLTIECSYEEKGYSSYNDDQEIIVERAFGGGSEEEFKFNNIKHHSAGERISIDMDYI